MCLYFLSAKHADTSWVSIYLITYSHSLMFSGLELCEFVIRHKSNFFVFFEKPTRYFEVWIDPNTQFYKSLVSCRVYVSDHISTTWLEAFYCDVPVILFLDLDQYFIVDEVKSLIEDLQAVGISHPRQSLRLLFKRKI